MDWCTHYASIVKREREKERIKERVCERERENDENAVHVILYNINHKNVYKV